jgi:tetratricopeptide (TPR) repeat protein
MCPILKKLSVQQQPIHEVIRIKDEILISKKGKDVRVLQHLLSYLEHQFGEKITGIDYRERGNGERISNWEVEVLILSDIYIRLADLYHHDSSMSVMSSYEISFAFLERSFNLLNPWLIQLDLDASNRTDSYNDHRIDNILNKLCSAEQKMANVTMNRRQLDIAEGHCQRCLAYSKRYGLEGEKKITNILAALITYCSLRQIQGDYSGAVAFAEDAYNLVVEAYDPVHPQVQEAAGVLIEVLNRKGDLFDAERYAQVTYGNLRDKKNGMDQESEVVAEGAYNLANVILKQKGDLIKAEKLARESLRIRTLIFDSNDQTVDVSCDLLARILSAQGKLGDETRGLYERSLAISIRNEGPDGLNAATGSYNIGLFYHQLAAKQSTADATQTYLILAKSHFVEAQRIWSKTYGPTYPNVIDASSRLTDILRQLSQLCVIYI